MESIEVITSVQRRRRWTLARLSQARRRDGAFQWGMSEEAADPCSITEWFFVESWAEHLRQHQRVSHANADVQVGAVRFHIGSELPRVNHYLAICKPHAGQGCPWSPTIRAEFG